MASAQSSSSSRKARVLSIALVICLLTVSTPAAPRTIVDTAKSSAVALGFWYRASGLGKMLQNPAVGKSRQEKQTERDGKVVKLKIFPGDVTVQPGARVNFSAVAYDGEGSTVTGVRFKWTSQAISGKKPGPLSPHGEFRAMIGGQLRIIAEGAGQRAEVTLTVSVPEGFRIARPDEKPIGAPRKVSNRERLEGKTEDTGKPQASNSTQRTDEKSTAKQTRSKSARKGATFAHRRSSATIPPSAPMLPPDGWNDENFLSSTDPNNDVGDPPGTPMDGGVGSRNFQFSAPILGLTGRGTNISLTASYNSRLWNKSGNQLTYDIDRGWPSPGWNLGFGKLLGMGVFNGGMLVEPDGTRHSYTGDVTVFPSGTNFVGHTTDGSFIDYTYHSGPGGPIQFAEAKLPNGTIISYGAPGPGAVYPTQILDANGNFITISYVGNSGPRIESITDTVGRAIVFYYNENNLLTAIQAPGLNGGSANTLVRFHYQQLALNYSFNSSITPVVRDSAPWMIDAIYYPGTGTGYWFGDPDSYSTYGMLKNVSERRGMTFSGPDPIPPDQGPTGQGTITSAGLVTREETYNYPLNPSDTTGTQASNLTDAPSYTSLIERWTRDGAIFDSATTGFLVDENASPRTVMVTLPNGIKITQKSYNHPGVFDDGLVFEDETRDGNDGFLQSSSTAWEQGAYGSPRPHRIVKTNELLQLTASEFSYGSVYNQVIESRDYDFGGANLRRATRTTYQNSPLYTGRHIFNLPLVTEIYDSDNLTPVARTEFQYDGQTLTQRADLIRHYLSYDPYADAEGYCYFENDWSDPDCQGPCSPELMGCDGYCPQLYYCPYDPATDYRGNVTQITTYADALTQTGAVTETRRYDIAGNVVLTSSACCEQTTFNYTVNTHYTYPEAQTRGSATDPFRQVSISATYDVNTGVVLTTTDANGRQSQKSYQSTTLRPSTTTLPTGAHTDFAYDDSAMTTGSTKYLSVSDGGGIVEQNVRLLNGQGQVRQVKTRGPDNGQTQTWDAVDTVYNNLGQVSQKSRPYRLGTETPQFTTATYDLLGRPTRFTAPDGSTIETYYNEKDFDPNDSYVPQRPDVASNAPGPTTLMRDPWGRERWGRADANGRLAEVVEPNPSGNGSVATGGLLTTYEYNALDKVSQIKSWNQSQVEQSRAFRYDSLGRMTAQKLAEVNSTLDNSGAYVGSGAWSDVFVYDNRSNLISQTDARGVKTIYSYFIGGNPNDPDPLNRLQSVSWDTSGFGDTSNPILPAATVTYQYRTKDNAQQLRDVTQVSGLTTAGVSTRSFDFDAEGRVFRKTSRLNDRTNFPFVTDYSFDSLNRVTDILYPAEYPNTTVRKSVHKTYDIASRAASLTYDGQSFASNPVYNASSQLTSLSVGTGTNQITETASYQTQTGLLENQTVMRGQTTLLNLSYDYANSNGKRTGQLTKILNNLNHNKDRGYSYDALGRLVQATGGVSTSPLWTQTYAYDKYGNRTSVTATGYSAKLDDKLKLVEPSDSRISLPTDLLAKDKRVDLTNQSGATVREGSEAISDSTTPLFKPSAKPGNSSAAPDGPPTFTNNPLEPGITIIQAVHITELRDAINALRVRAGLPTVGWAEAVTSGVIIKADHISEMRTRLDQALAALNLATGGYSAGLATGQPILAIHIQELRDRVTSAWNSSSQIPCDGHPSLSYDVASNRITTAGFAYDAAGNQVRALVAGSSSSQRFRYDAANRLVQVLQDNNTTVIATYTYGDSNERLVAEENGSRTYYDCEQNATMAEFTEIGGSTSPVWSKSYVYFASRLLATLTPNGSGGEAIQFHHPDRLGTRLVTDPVTGSSFEQVVLPFGTVLNAESTGATNKRFTTYDRSATTGLDYAYNRHYDSQQGRFTQVDPAGMNATSLDDPQTLNLYAYCANDPINNTDPSGLGFFSFLKKIFKAIGKFIAKVLTNKWVLLVVGIVLGAAAGLGFYWAATITTDVFLKAAIVLSAMSALLIVGAFHENFLRVVRTIGGIASQVQGVARSLSAIINGRTFGTPPWNPGSGSSVGPVSRFQGGATERPLTPEQGVIVWNAIMLAMKALERPECRKYVGAGAGAALRKLWDSGRITYFPGMEGGKGRGTAWAETGPGPGFFGGFRLRIALFYGAFDDQQIADPYRLNSAANLGITKEQFQAENLLHEIRHYLCMNCGYAEPHANWNIDIVKNCFK